jgi:hypothetical protein
MALVALTALLAANVAHAQGASAIQHMGPTGIHGYITGTRIFTVKTVEKGSPADGKIWPGDQVVGAGRQPFLKRVRFEFSAAVAEARTEKKKGKLVLMVRRKTGGKRMQRVTLQLGVVGADTFTDTAPYNCPKIDALITEAADHIVSKKARSPYGRLQIGLLGLLATGEDKYVKVVRDHLHEAGWAKPPEDTNALVNKSQMYASWYWGYKMLILTEYHLLTGDDYVLPAIRMYAEGMASGQDAAGLWGHQMRNFKTGRAPGYGVMNQPTMPVFISLILARKCGVDSPRISEAISRTTEHYTRKYVNKGALPYGNHGPNSKGYNNNGTSGSLAVAFAAAGHVAGARFFSRMSMAAYNDLESGHATHFFNLMWTGLGANIGGPEASAAFFKKTSWLYPLKVDWKGGYTYELDTHEGLGNTGAYLLNLCAGRRKLHMTGKGADPAIALNTKEVAETIDVHKYANELIPMDATQLLAVVETHWSPLIRRSAAWKLLKFKREELAPVIGKRLAVKRTADALTGVSRFWDTNPKLFDQVAAIMRDPNADLALRCAAAGTLGGAAWSRYLEPEEEFGRDDLYEGGELHKPAVKYFADLVQVIVEDEKDDPWGLLDGAAGAALAGLGDPYTQNLITDKPLFYAAINKMLAHKHSSGTRTGAMKLIADSMPMEDFHYVADRVVHAARGTDRSYTVYRGDNCTELGVKLLWRLNIQEAVEVCLDSFPTATRGKERARRIALFESFGANGKPYLPRLKAALKQDPDAEAEGSTKDVSLNQAEVEKFIQTIETATNPRTTISLEEAKARGK